jgi:propanol-preferring alcohol dehydrogenase
LVEPGPGHVRISVEACGVCHSDVGTVEADRAADNPRVPGHEIVGHIDAVGDGVTGWGVGQRVGVGFLGGPDGVCVFCRRGDFVNCTNQPRTGGTTDGGYAESVVVRASGLVAIPDDLDSVQAAPLLCAGLTVFNALRLARPAPGSLVAIQGIGGLGHLGIQYARTLGVTVVAVARGGAKEDLARQLGAHHYIDSNMVDVSTALQSLGGAEVIVATASSGRSMFPLVAGLSPHGQLVVVGVSEEPIEVSPRDLVFGMRGIAGSLTGSAIENEDNVRFVMQNGIRVMVEEFPLEEAATAYTRMMSSEARFRVVLTIGI